MVQDLCVRYAPNHAHKMSYDVLTLQCSCSRKDNFLDELDNLTLQDPFMKESCKGLHPLLTSRQTFLGAEPKAKMKIRFGLLEQTLLALVLILVSSSYTSVMGPVHKTFP